MAALRVEYIDPLLEILQQCPVPVYVHQDSILVFANRATYEALGIPSGSVGIDVFSFVAPEEREVAKVNRDRILASGQLTKNIQRVLLDAKGRRRMSLGCARPILWKGRPALEVSFVLLDEPMNSDHAIEPEKSVRDEAIGKLSGRERQVAMLVARGMSTLNIAASLGIAESTVRTMLRAAFRKTGTHARIDLARLVMGFQKD